MKSYLKEGYTDNHILNFLKYWQKLATQRMENDLDCLYLGNLLADTIFSVFIPMNMVVEYLNPGLVINKMYKGDKHKDLRILQKNIESRGILLPKDNELIILLNRYACLAETRANTMEIPDNKMQNRNKYDQIPNMLYNCFNGGKFHKYFNFNENFVKEWIVKEKLQMLFTDENKLTRDSIRPLIHILKPNQVKLLKRFDPDKNKNLVVLHAWGAKERKGFYGEVCNVNNKKRKTVRDVPKNLGLKPNEGLGYLCSDLLEDLECNIVPYFDAILIDEGQDLVVDNEILKYNEKQPIYWLAYKSLKSFDEEQPELKRLIWAYDEGQSLDNLSIPKASELFGDNPKLKNLVTGIYPGGIRKSEIMYRCYRTPREILTSAHAIGMGLLREEGMLRGFTNKDDWEKIGYIIENGTFKSGQEIELYRPEENSPNLTSKYWKGDIIKFETFDSREEELENLSKKIKYNIEIEGLNPSREILVIILGNKKDAPKLEQEVANYLIKKGIVVYIPTAKENNIVNPQYPNQDKDKFWNDGGVTVSRIHRAKGNEAEMVYVVGFDKIAQDEDNINLRNQVFVALTRARCWVNLSGINEYPMYDEMRNVINSNGRFKFVFKRPPKFDVGEEAED